MCSLALILGPLAPSLSFNFRLRIVVAMLFFLAGALWALRMAITGRLEAVKTGMGWPALVFFGAVACSAAAAWSTRDALLHALSWAAYAVGFLVILNASGHYRTRHFLIVFLISAGVVVAAHGFHQVFVSLPETRAEFYEDPAEALRQVGVPLDAEYDFAGRLGKDRVMSTFLLPTSLAGFLILVIPIAVGFALDQWRDRRLVLPPVHFVLLTIFILLTVLCLYQTKSKGGWLAFAVAMSAFYVGSARWFKRRYGRVLLALLACVVVVALVAQQARMLPPLRDYGSSLLARVAYWRAAAMTVAQHPALGVGPGGFAEAYSIHKRPQDEETRFAHNDYLQIGAEIGLVGLVGYLAMWWRFWRKARLKTREVDVEALPPESGGLWAAWPLAAGGLAFALAFAFGLLPGSRHGAWGWLWPLSLAALWAGVALMNVRPAAVVNVDGGMTNAGLCAGLAGFLAHGLLDFDLFVQGIAQTVAVAAALALSARTRGCVIQKSLGSGARLALAAVPTGLALALWVGLGDRAMRASALFEDANSPALELSPKERIDLLERSAALDPLHARVHASLAQHYYQHEGNLAQAVRSAREAVRLNPAMASHRELLATLHLETHRITSNPESLANAYAEMREAARLFPSYPRLHAQLAQVAGRMGRHGEQLHLLREALQLDSRQAIPRRRFDAEERAALEERVAQLEERMNAHSRDGSP